MSNESKQIYHLMREFPVLRDFLFKDGSFDESDKKLFKEITKLRKEVEK